MPTSRLCFLGYSTGALCAVGDETVGAVDQRKLVQQDEGSASPWVLVDSGRD